MRNVRLVIEYDGTGLAGWQRQPNGPTVQAHLEDALAGMVGGPVTVGGASRTDAGVHARGQVANFRTESTIPAHGFRRGLNSLLPPAIAILDAADVAPEFDARRSAIGKRYRYALLTRPDRSPLLRHRAWHRGRPLDRAAMAAAAACLIGEHDFTSFRAAGCSARHAIRRITAITLNQPDPAEPVLWIDVHGNAFLRNMVRIVAGTLVAVGLGDLAPADLPDVLASRDRARAGPTAPAHGLTLLEVHYPPAPMTHGVMV